MPSPNRSEYLKTREETLIDSKMLALILIIGAEVMIFGGLLSAFVVLKVNQVMWPPYGMPKYPVLITGINTLILISSGVFFEYFLKNKKDSFLISSALSLFLFLAIQFKEWVDLLNFGLNLLEGVYGSIYLIVIGFHALHVVIALFVQVLNIKSFNKINEEQALKESFNLSRMYLWFVILIWPIVYFIVYF